MLKHGLVICVLSTGSTSKGNLDLEISLKATAIPMSDKVTSHYPLCKNSSINFYSDPLKEHNIFW